MSDQHPSGPATRPTGLTVRQVAEMKAWGQDQIALWEERAAILEFDAGMSRDEAERTAWEWVKG